jgi:glyoxylase-like metal-dependent hydrolase (beta-lactamase superfamily II)
MSDLAVRPRTVGDFRVWRLAESEGSDPLTTILPTATEERIAPHRDWLEPHFLQPDHVAFLATLSFVVQTPSHTLLIDTCTGRDKTGDNPPTSYLDTLAQCGFASEDIDLVIVTHLHFDHVGGCTRLADGRWIPTFPNARYLLVRKEWDHWKNVFPPGVHNYTQDKIVPLIEAAKLDLVERGAAIAEGVWLEDLPGHTPGHTGVHFKSSDQELVIAGDLMHHPIQVGDPDLKTEYDVDTDEATQVRKAFLNRYADTGVLIGCTHFAAPTFGHIVRGKDALRFVAAPPSGS